MSRFNTISFISDYGLTDEFVGVTKSVLRSMAPEVAVIDITHSIEAHDVRAGGLALARAVQFLAPGVVLGVIDPGAGSERKAIAIEVADGQAYLVGPDNGLFAPAVSLVGGATAAVVLDNPEYQLPAANTSFSGDSLFSGRDIFAPAAAHLCLGVSLNELGTAIDPSGLMPGVLPVSQLGDEGEIAAEVLWIDGYGNVQLNVDPDEIKSWIPQVQVVGGRTTRTAQRVDHSGQVPTGGLGLLTDSSGLLALVVDRGSAAFELELAEGDAVTLRPGDSGIDSPAAAAVAVTLGKRDFG